ncbi:hypothetical protein HYV86_06450 [Candidatus Woesearchaeota archaeon]|nr:hypothetical protein [Candidatus Woesearchaeota archaeon]
MGIFDKLLGRKDEPNIDFDALTKHELERDPFKPQSDPFSPQTDSFDQPSSAFPSTPTFTTPTRPSPYQEPHFSSPEPPRFSSSSQNASGPYGRDKELELINSKLDTIKAMLAAMEQRLNSLEQPPSQERRRVW